MEKTVNTAWYAKKCALGTLVCCGTELVLLMLASALILRGAISAWVTMQVIGFFVYDGLTPERSLELAAAMAVGAVAPLLLQRNGKKGRGAKARARRKRR